MVPVGRIGARTGCQGGEPVPQLVLLDEGDGEEDGVGDDGQPAALRDHDRAAAVGLVAQRDHPVEHGVGPPGRRTSSATRHSHRTSSAPVAHGWAATRSNFSSRPNVAMLHCYNTRWHNV